MLGEQGKNTGPLFLALVPESEREMKTLTLLSFRVRWNLGAEPVPLLAGEHSALCSEEISRVIPAESAGGHREHSYLSHWGMVLAPVPAENQWSSAAQEPASMCQVGMQGTQPPS